MADYPTMPTRLSTLDATTPADTEDVAKLGSSVRQVKAILKSLLSVALDDSGNLKVVAALSPNSVQTTQLADQPNGVTTNKINDAAVSHAKLATDSVGTANIIDANVTEAKLHSDAVTRTKIKAGEVQETHFGTAVVSGTALKSSPTDDSIRAVGTNHIKNAAITDAKVASASIGLDKLASAGAASILAGTGTGVSALTNHADSVIVPSVVSGQLKLAFAPTFNPALQDMAIIKIRGTGSTTPLTPSVITTAGQALTWNGNERPRGASMQVEYDARSIVQSIDSVNVTYGSTTTTVQVINIAKAGKYYCEFCFTSYGKLKALGASVTSYNVYNRARIGSVAVSAGGVINITDLLYSLIGSFSLDRVGIIQTQLLMGRGVFDTVVDNTLLVIQEAFVVLPNALTTYDTTPATHVDMFADYQLGADAAFNINSIPAFDHVYLRKLT